MSWMSTWASTQMGHLLDGLENPSVDEMDRIHPYSSVLIRTHPYFALKYMNCKVKSDMMLHFQLG